MRQQGPHDPGILVGQRDRRHIQVAPLEQPAQPVVGLVRLALGGVDHRARPVNQQRAQVGVATLAHAQQRGLAAARMLARHQAQPGRHLAPAGEVLCVAYAGHQRAGRDRADPRDLLELSAGLVLGVPGLDLEFHLADLQVEHLELIHQALHQEAKRTGQLVGGILDQLGHALGDVSNALGDDDAELAQQAPDLVGLRGARLDKPLAHAVQCEH